MSAKRRIWQYLMNKGQATNWEIAEHMRGSKGQLSWSQRIRELRKEIQLRGGDITCEETKPGVYLYKIVYPPKPEPKDTELEAAIRRNNLAREEQINFAQINA